MEVKMLFTPILDIALALVFIYFILSTISSSVNEIIANVTNLRATQLKKAIEDLLFDEKWKSIAKDIISSPYIKVLQKDEGDDFFPVDIPASVFSNAFIHTLQDVYKVSFKPAQLSKLPSKVGDTDTGIFLRSIILGANGDVEKARTLIENYYNSAMDGLTKLYKKNVKRFSFIFAFIIAVILNIDTINIATNLWNSPQARESAASGINSILNSNNKLVSSFKIDTARIDNASKKLIMTQLDSIKQSVVAIGKADSTLRLIPIPIGWESGNYPEMKAGTFNLLGLLTKLIGWVITAFAIMLGAPFWFDVLNKITGLKSSLKKE
jgi:hypothetical protein